MNSATKLTLLRICLIPLIMVLNTLDSPFNSWVSLGVFLVASLTDLLDGYLARKRNQVTTLGKLLDPLADKLLVLTAFLVIFDRNLVTLWLITILIGREMAITGLRAFLAAERILMPAAVRGKWRMVIQFIALSFLFVANEFEIFWIIGIITIHLALFFSLLSAYFYVKEFWEKLGEKIMAEQIRGGS